MRKFTGFLLLGALLFGAGVLVGQKTAAPKKSLIHAFAFQQVEGTTPPQMDELWAETRRMAGQIPEIKNIWMGKVTNRDGLYGVVMEFDNQAGLKTYAAHPAHTKWNETYSKVRVEGTTTLDIQGQ